MKTSNLINSIILASASSILSNFLTLERKEVKDLKAEGDKSVEDLANFFMAEICVLVFDEEIKNEKDQV
jgi:hypothetical protein